MMKGASTLSSLLVTHGRVHTARLTPVFGNLIILEPNCQIEDVLVVRKTEAYELSAWSQ